jgi:hypothetical protein
VEQLRGIVALLDGPTSPLEGEPITMPITAAFEQIPLTMLRDPWDRLITATAMTLEVPLVTADAKIRRSGLGRDNVVATSGLPRSYRWSSITAGAGSSHSY